MSTAGTFAPLRHRWYRRLFLVGTVSYVATWMQTVAATWLMTSLTSSSLWVGLISTAVSLPMFVLGLPAGVLADLADRRHLMLATQGAMLLAMLLLAVTAAFGVVTPALLLGLTLLLGIASAMHAPAWSATVGEAVPHEDMPQALTLNGMSFNSARTVGPALAGALIALIGTGWVFAINALVYGLVISVLFRWKPTAALQSLPPERLWGGVRSAVRYFRHARALPGYLVRLGFFVLGGSAVLTLLPVVAQTELQMGAEGFGLLMGAFGIGGVTGALLLQHLRRMLSPNAYVSVATIVFAAVLLITGFARWHGWLFIALFLGGSVWINAITEIFAAITSAVPGWIRGRATAFHLLTTQGAIAVGGIVWGSIADLFGLRVAFAAAAVLLLLSLGLSRRFPIRMGSGRDLLPARADELPQALEQPEPDAGPVAVEIAYRIDPPRQEEFLDAARRLGRVRRRNGAITWRLYRDLSDPDRLLERFVVPSWVDFERQRARWTQADAQIEERLRAFQRDGVPITSAHFVAER